MAKLVWSIGLISILTLAVLSCNPKNKMQTESVPTAKEILGNPTYRALSYGGYRQTSRDVQPTIQELKNDMKILSAMGIGIIRTYNVHLAHATNVLKAIRELKKEDENFEMYVMLGAWIDCKNAWTEHTPDHSQESERNQIEIAKAVELANEFPDIVKIIAVGNEAMVKWAATYFVQPEVILKWVNHLQELKESGELPKDLWITSSDNFASWGGGDPVYHTEDLNELIKAVDYISLHTYPMHDTHYNPQFWGVLESEGGLSKKVQIDKAMARALDYAIMQYTSVKEYVSKIDPNKPLHIGETGWASSSNGHYGVEGSLATDEYKEGLYYQLIRDWSDEEEISCFYFEAFDENWKDAQNQGGSENHFGLFTLEGKAKYPVWSSVDEGVFKGLTRRGNQITKTYGGNEEELFKTIPVPPIKEELTIAH